MLQQFNSWLYTWKKKPTNKKRYMHLNVHSCIIYNACMLNCFIQVWLFVTPWPHGLWLPGSSDHGTLQAKILEWVAIPSSRVSPTQIEPCLLHLPALAVRSFTTSTTWKVHYLQQQRYKSNPNVHQQMNG